MIKANFNAYNSYVTDSLFQWERNQKLEISGLNLVIAPEIHFSNAEMDKAIVRQSVLTDGIVTVDIPNSMLQSGFDINVYIGIYEGETFKIIETVCIPIKPRKKPEDYILEVDDHEVYSFKALENKLNNLIAHNGDTGSNSELLDIRVGSDGKMYRTAGDSVRGQYESLYQKIEELNRGGLQMKDGVIGKNVENWLNAHPEATSTVMDGSLTLEKMVVGALGYVTPEMYGAVGDGIHDDSDALEKIFSSNKKIIMKDDATYKLCRPISPTASTLNIDGHGATIVANDDFIYKENICYGFIQFQNYQNKLKEFVVKNLNIDITTNGILYGDRVLGDERSCPIFRIYHVGTIIIDNCHWCIDSNSGNRAILWSDGMCSESICITNSKFVNKCAGNAGGVIAISMRNDEKDIYSYMANCELITDSCDELYAISNCGMSDLYSTIDSCIMVNHGGFTKHTTKKTIILATNHEGTGDLIMCVNATKIEYDGPETDQMLGVFKLSSLNSAIQKVNFRGCTVSNPCGHAIEGALGTNGHAKYLSVDLSGCKLIGGNSALKDIIDNIGHITINNCDLIGDSYVSYFYPMDYTNHFVLKNSKITLKNPKGVLHVHYKRRHIINICENLYSGNYQSIQFEFDQDDPKAPNVDLQKVENNVYAE